MTICSSRGISWQRFELFSQFSGHEMTFLGRIGISWLGCPVEAGHDGLWTVGRPGVREPEAAGSVLRGRRPRRREGSDRAAGRARRAREIPDQVRDDGEDQVRDDGEDQIRDDGKDQVRDDGVCAGLVEQPRFLRGKRPRCLAKVLAARGEYGCAMALRGGAGEAQTACYNPAMVWMRVLSRWRSQWRARDVAVESGAREGSRDERAAEATAAAMPYITTVAKGIASNAVRRK